MEQREVCGLVADVNDDEAVDMLDRAVVLGVWSGSGFTCKTDLNSLPGGRVQGLRPWKA